MMYRAGGKHPEPEESGKVDKATALYFTPESMGTKEGGHCGVCMMFVGNPTGEGHCTVVSGKIDGVHGICGLYVHGKHSGPDMHGMLTHNEAGYVTTGPTHCGNCEYFERASNECQKVRGKVEALGCCNLWEGED